MKKICIILVFTIFLSSQIIATTGAGKGRITGRLTYPSDGIPTTMIVCVTRILKRSYTVCSNYRNKRGFVFRVNRAKARYSISLPAGNYYIYATFPRGKAPTDGMERYRAYYSQFVRCGMSVECHSHKRLIVRVRTGRTTSGIMVGDWYI
jgi:hypothetical protein